MAKFHLTPEQLDAAKKAKSPEELVAMAKAHGIAITAEQAKAFLAPPVGEISDQELANVASGGCSAYPWDCPKCGSDDIRMLNDPNRRQGSGERKACCNRCSHIWVRQA